MKIYFVTVGLKDEIATIKKLQPENLLISYFYFKKREKIDNLLTQLEYRPNILFDSGAFSAYNIGKDIALTSYIKFLKDNSDLIKEYVQLDVFENEFMTKNYYDIMKHEGLNPIPVYHYGYDESLLQYFISQGEKRIALGGTVPVSNKSKVAEWAKYYCWLYPTIDFHLLGSCSLKILDHCDLNSVDASSWIMNSINGKPNHIKSKTDRMEYHMKRLMNYEEESD